MRGGTEDPCVSPLMLLKIQKDTPDQSCPRVDLAEGNEEAAELALMAAKSGADNGIWSRLFDLHSEELDHDGKMQLFRRTLNAVGDEGISEKIKRERERKH
jgi:hypothetical protein